MRTPSRAAPSCLEGLEESGEHTVYANDVKSGHYRDSFNLLGNSRSSFEDNCLQIPTLKEDTGYSLLNIVITFGVSTVAKKTKSRSEAYVNSF